MQPLALRQAIRQALADPNLQTALDGNALRRVQGRAKAIDTLPDWEERRQRARAVRAQVIESLPEYLNAFIQKAQANGIQVHRAANNAEAVSLITRLALQARPENAAGPTVIAKSKSMVSEEIELNPALEAAGLKVVETDLGEYIIQLRGERPSHLIAPAVHLRRGQVGQLFHEKLGIPYTEDIPTLTNTARKMLRQVFLSAQVGLSGVNFGVAESGSLCIVTNEGNGRMVTTLPKVHIALMGMERLVPTLDDLALMLSLLPRSATGQKMSVYTQLINRPLAGQTRHLVIVDNGRERLRQSTLREALYCIRCGACLNACPVFRELGGHSYRGQNGAVAPYPGPIGSVISPGLLGENYSPLAQASTLCGACQEACPVKIDLPALLLRIRAGEIPAAERPAAPGQGLPAPVTLGLKLFTRVAEHPTLYAAAQTSAAALSAPLPSFLPAPAFTGWGFSKDFPKPDPRPFRQRWRELEKAPVSQAAASTPNPPAVSAPAKAAPAPAQVERFIAEVTALGGEVLRLRPQEIQAALLRLLQREGIQSLQTWSSLPGVDLNALRAAGLRLSETHADDLQAGLSGALAAVAETGTLLIAEAPGQPLTASLVPPIHLALLPISRLKASLEEALALPEVKTSAALALISGPSRTADIEMALTIGVHGPGKIILLLIEA